MILFKRGNYIASSTCWDALVKRGSLFLRLTARAVARPPTFPCKAHSLCVLRTGDLSAIDSQHGVSDLQSRFLSSAVCKETDNKDLIEAGSQIECPAVCPLFKKLFLSRPFLSNPKQLTVSLIRRKKLSSQPPFHSLDLVSWHIQPGIYVASLQYNSSCSETQSIHPPEG